MISFIPNKVKRFVHRDPPWINKQVKLFLIETTGFIKNSRNMTTRLRIKLDSFREECKEAVKKC